MQIRQIAIAAAILLTKLRNPVCLKTRFSYILKIYTRYTAFALRVRASVAYRSLFLGIINSRT